MEAQTAQAGSRALVGRTVSVIDKEPAPSYFQAIHHTCAGKTGRVHAIVPGSLRANPLVKVGFDDGSRIVFFRLEDLTVHEDAPPVHPPKHGKRGSHLPRS
ncbi:MAG: hypothetical protein ACR2KS_08375 [Candidatus Eremiobacter antarcticus]|nr:hypothetical protein [Candidatus Eremiobacteraeota bacterium]